MTLLSEFIKDLQNVLEQQGDGTIVFDVPERDSFSSNIQVVDKFYQGNADYLCVGENRRPYCFIMIENEE